MEFITLPQLARELKKAAKVLQYKFKNSQEEHLSEGEDFVREGYIDDKHFLYKINQVRFVALTQLNPAPLPDEIGYQTVNNVDYQRLSNCNKTVTNFGNQPPESDTKRDTQPERTTESDTQERKNNSVVTDLLN